MSAAREGDGRIASIGAALLTEPEDPLGTARLLARLFEEVLLVGPFPSGAPGRRIAAPEAEGALGHLVAALDAAGPDRVLAVGPGAPPLEAGAVLALVAWPEADAVVPRTPDGSPPDVGLYRRDAILPVARRHLAERRASLAALLDAVDTAWVPPP